VIFKTTCRQSNGFTLIDDRFFFHKSPHLISIIETLTSFLCSNTSADLVHHFSQSLHHPLRVSYETLTQAIERWHHQSDRMARAFDPPYYARWGDTYELITLAVIFLNVDSWSL
jgi:hypothetical protein